jgi:hypothetical protein
MKKILLLSTIALSSFAFAQVQTIVNENFNSLTLGNLGTDVTGATPGQNNWYTSNGTNASYQISNIDVAHGKSLLITSGNSYVATNNPNNRTAAQLTTVTATATNNIVKATLDIYTGSSTGSGNYYFLIYGDVEGSNKPIGGFRLDVATRKINGLGTFYNGTVPTLYLAIDPATAPVFPINTWVSVTYYYNKTTGDMTWIWPGGGANATADPDAIVGMTAQSVYLQNTTSTGNTAANTVGFDNILVQFGNASTFAVTDVKNEITDKIISVYPNPTSKILTIKSKDKIKNVTLSDMTGKKIDVKLNESSIDVESLPEGRYFITVETNNGIFSDKFIKK